MSYGRLWQICGKASIIAPWARPHLARRALRGRAGAAAGAGDRGAARRRGRVLARVAGPARRHSGSPKPFERRRRHVRPLPGHRGGAGRPRSHRRAGAAHRRSPEEHTRRVRRRVQHTRHPLHPPRSRADRQAHPRPVQGGGSRARLHPNLPGEPGAGRELGGARTEGRRLDRRPGVRGHHGHERDQDGRPRTSGAGRLRGDRTCSHLRRSGAGQPTSAAADARPRPRRDDAPVRASRRGAALRTRRGAHHRRRRTAGAGQRRGPAAAAPACGRRGASDDGRRPASSPRGTPRLAAVSPPTR